MTGHHLLIQGGRMNVECSEPATASCHVVYDCFCEEPYNVGAVGYGNPYHLPSGGGNDLHVGRFDPDFCGVKDWFSTLGPEDLLSGEYAIPLRVEWKIGGPTLHLPEPTEEDR